MRTRRSRIAPPAPLSPVTPPAPPASAAPPLTPLQAIRAIAWAAALEPDEIFWSIRRAPEVDLAAKWPELSTAQIQTMQRRCTGMSRNRIREWNRAEGDGKPTWLEVRALISGMHLILE